MKDPASLSDADRLLAARVSATLDQVAARPDPVLEQALAEARARARDPRAGRRQPSPWLWASGMALAAGLAMIFVLPGNAPAPQHPVAPIAKHTPGPVDDPEMLEDLDMLQALSAGGSKSTKS